MNCQKCGFTLQDNFIFCPGCGARIGQLPKRKVKSRGNGQGTAYKRGNSWTASVVVGWELPKDPSVPKKPIRRTKGGFATKRDAIAYCPTLLAGGFEKPSEAPRLSEYWKIYSEGDMLKLSKGKQSAYRTAWKKLSSIHEVRVDAITVELLRKVVSESCPTFDPAKDCKSLLTNIFELAAADRFAVRELPSYIILPEHEEREQTPFTREEQQRIWTLYDNGDRRAAAHLLMIYTGMMPGEAMLLKKENIDMENRVIIRSGMKTKIRKRTPVVIADCILPVVQDLIDNAMPSGYIWRQNEKIWYDNYYAVLEEAGCRKLPPYSCRHTTATCLAVDSNVAPQTIRKIMRWSTTRMLDRYAHPQTEDALEGVNQLSKPETPSDELPSSSA